MTQARVEPVQPPYTEDLQTAFTRIMPPGVEPLKLFTSLAHNPRVLQRFFAGGLLDHGSISLADRELLILRTTARCGAEYEWGVHVAFYTGKTGFSQAQLADTCRAAPDAGVWRPEQLALLALADSLHDKSTLDDVLWGRLREHFSDEQLIECLSLVGFYHTVSFLLNGLRVEREEYAPRFPG
ncbi:carboxymuconolactone decarboxylase family protein [Aquipseudomonas alcaligenes]|uniref:carboxymuconolactone decarboxylase family protein n=1 Tax=Aquipseudomonas alcaligenes TaxID=43263 RepID=UPI003749F251